MHLSKEKIKNNQKLALFMSSLVFALGGLICALFADTLLQWVLSGSLLFALSFGCYRLFTKKYRERQALENTPFPEKWRQILEEDVLFYKALDPTEKKRFETEVQIFLHETRVTGVQTEIDDRTLVLAAASAEIPVFSFPDWEYNNLGEILIYPNAFSKDFRLTGPDRTITGMVGTGLMQGIMILSKTALIDGFKNKTDKNNVGIHEFAHLLDAADGVYDGVPSLFLEHQYLAPWLAVMHKETERIKAGKSNMNPYGATNLVEFFAVATEYFFEQPHTLKKNKPELYALLSKIFNQDTKSKLKYELLNLVQYNGKRVKRNSPCPCNSGKKYKNCCLKNAR